MSETVQKEEVFTPSEAAKALGISVGTLGRWSREGKIVPLRYNDRCFRYTREEIERVMAVATVGKSTSNQQP
jgi:predicted site-specific integrase-resolvase